MLKFICVFGIVFLMLAIFFCECCQTHKISFIKCLDRGDQVRKKIRRYFLNLKIYFFSASILSSVALTPEDFGSENVNYVTLILPLKNASIITCQRHFKCN